MLTTTDEIRELLGSKNDNSADVCMDKNCRECVTTTAAVVNGTLGEGNTHRHTNTISEDTEMLHKGDSVQQHNTSFVV